MPQLVSLLQRWISERTKKIDFKTNLKIDGSFDALLHPQAFKCERNLNKFRNSFLAVSCFSIEKYFSHFTRLLCFNQPRFNLAPLKRFQITNRHDTTAAASTWNLILRWVSFFCYFRYKHTANDSQQQLTLQTGTIQQLPPQLPLETLLCRK